MTGNVRIDIRLQTPRWKTVLKPYGNTVRKACGAALESGLGIRDSGFGKNKYEITVVLANDSFVHDLNKTFRGKNKPTNVLSFPESRIPNPESRYLGDIVLALETVKREAREQGKTLKDHATHLLVHGTLHLLGYDHERRKDAAAMERLETEILKKLAIANPYL